jgi:hypothetical protein
LEAATEETAATVKMAETAEMDVTDGKGSGGNDIDGGGNDKVSGGNNKDGGSNDKDGGSGIDGRDGGNGLYYWNRWRQW